MIDLTPQLLVLFLEDLLSLVKIVQCLIKLLKLLFHSLSHALLELFLQIQVLLLLLDKLSSVFLYFLLQLSVVYVDSLILGLSTRFVYFGFAGVGKDANNHISADSLCLEEEA